MNNSDDKTNSTERTYPVAFNFATASVQKLKSEVTPPDSLNTNAYVAAVISCPPNAYCILPNGILISDSLDAKTGISQLFLTLRKPRQFKEDSLYQFSLKIGIYPGSEKKHFELLGYKLLQIIE